MNKDPIIGLVIYLVSVVLVIAVLGFMVKSNPELQKELDILSD